MENQTQTRLAGAWTRTGGTTRKPVPQGRLHATRRVMGSLEPVALCGFRIPAKAMTTRPFPIFDETNPRACSTCVTESWEVW
jgi:hypothetical protein